MSNTLHSYKNITNQPIFGSTPVCDQFVRLFNTSIASGQYAPTMIKGDVSVVKPFFPTTTTFRGVYGVKVDNAFIEYNVKSCESLQGYSGTGPGD